MRPCRILGTMAVAATAMTFADVAAARVSPSSYCVAIDVTLETEAGLVEIIDSFARGAELSIDSSHPAMRIYFARGVDIIYPTESTVMVVLRNGMGRFGSILTYTPLRDGAPPDLLDKLQRFVSDEIADKYSVVKCAEIKGFTAPVLYH